MLSKSFWAIFWSHLLRENETVLPYGVWAGFMEGRPGRAFSYEEFRMMIGSSLSSSKQ